MAYAVLILIPLAAAALIAFFESRTRTAIRAIAFLATLTCLVATSYLVYANAIGKIPVVDFEWLPLLGSYLYFKASGLALSLILLTSLLALLAVIGSFNLSIENEKLYYSMLLILFSSLFGVFLARDFLLFYLFWEAVLIPMYFLIGIFGSENRRYAATKFFIYTFVASILMLIGIFIVSTVSPTLKFEDLIASASQLSYDKRLIAFALIFLGFAVKLPTFPFHTWLPDAHVQAPTQASVLLAGILLKMGGYGLFELLGPMFPDLINEYARLFLGLAAVSVIYGALTAYAQKDAKKLVAYSSIAHMGFVTAAFSAYNHAGSKTAAGFVMWAHGLITGMLFFLVGLTYERFHSRDLDVIKHLAIRYP
ncbi:MAG: NADH-quinone oxidoreductase subunit M, partial [Actinobacteria bacterium]|nr:NADH-quinone oxidoreductase subunit M [Actinomycetota bacterium]